ncbi:DUF6338 family protein [Micromonospora sp. WMMD735]|uniref:DUF6338 family protein n=1 Tax=Micromonospora sp. WMMD735 TaxID=3404130 RepID=UPI003B939AD1
MVPSSLLGLVLFVVLLAPGLVFVLRHEKAVPSGPRSAFRETLRVVFVSVASLSVTMALAAIVRWIMPEHTVNIRALVRNPVPFARGHHVQLAWWAFGLMVFATVLAWVAADPRLVRLSQNLESTAPLRWITGKEPTDITEVSTWWRAFFEQKKTDGKTIVGVLQDNDSYVQGTLLSWSTGTVDYDKRELILTAPLIYVTADGVTHELPVHMIVIAARNIVRLDVTHLLPEGAPQQKSTPEAGATASAGAAPASQRQVSPAGGVP